MGLGRSPPKDQQSIQHFFGPSNKRTASELDAEMISEQDATRRMMEQMFSAQTEVLKSLSAQQVQKIEELGDKLGSRVDQVEARVSHLEGTVNHFCGAVENCDSRIADLEQKLLENHLDIVGIATPVVEEGRSDPKRLVIDLLSSYHIHMQPEMIQKAYIRSVPVDKRIITVEFVDLDTKLSVMQQKRASKDQRKIYFDNRLTRSNRQLFMMARDMVKKKVIASAYIYSGKVMATTNEGMKFRVKSSQDIEATAAASSASRSGSSLTSTQSSTDSTVTSDVMR